MKYKIGDKVRLLNSLEFLRAGIIGEVVMAYPDESPYPYDVQFGEGEDAVSDEFFIPLNENEIELV